MSERDRRVSVRVAAQADAERLNREYWAAIPPHERLAQVWDLVCEYVAWRTPDARQSRLQRSVLRVERR